MLKNVNQEELKKKKKDWLLYNCTVYKSNFTQIGSVINTV